jgi:hypothetical protein
MLTVTHCMTSPTPTEPGWRASSNMRGLARLSWESWLLLLCYAPTQETECDRSLSELVASCWSTVPQYLPRRGQKDPIDSAKCWQRHKHRYDPCHVAIQVISKCLSKGAKQQWQCRVCSDPGTQFTQHHYHTMSLHEKNRMFLPQQPLLNPELGRQRA